MKKRNRTIILSVLIIAALLTFSCQTVNNLAGGEDQQQEEEQEDLPSVEDIPDDELPEAVVEEPVEEDPEVEETEPEIEEPVVEEEPVEPDEDTNFLICQVTDVGGIDDKSFNATAWKGVKNAMADFPNVEGVVLESQLQLDYQTNLNIAVEDDCDLIIAVGFKLADATAAAAEANPDQLIAIIDVDYLDFPNLRGSGFAINEATFLNGYLAAGMTQTGKVGTYVGIAFPATTIFMDGYVLGVEHYNAVHGTDVEVLGWEIDTQKGLATGDFENTDNGRVLGESLLDEGVDIIMPVAGPVGLGTLAAMEDRGTGLLIGVDNDWSRYYPAFADYILASAMKNMDKFVYDTVAALVDGEFEAGNWIGTLDNGGVGIAYGSSWIDLIPDDLKDEIEQISVEIIAGTISTLP